LTKKEQLKHLLGRKKKADSLPGRERQKWKRQIEELEKCILQLKKDLGMYVIVGGRLFYEITEDEEGYHECPWIKNRT
jgi:hypothetical protein